MACSSVAIVLLNHTRFCRCIVWRFASPPVSSRHINVVRSVGRTVFLTEHPSTHSDSSVTLNMGERPAPWTQHHTNSSWSISTVGTNCKFDFAPVARVLRGVNDIVNYSACVGILRRSIVLGPRSPGTSSKHTTNLLYRASSIYTIFTTLSCTSQIIRDGLNQWYKVFN